MRPLIRQRFDEPQTAYRACRKTRSVVRVKELGEPNIKLDVLASTSDEWAIRRSLNAGVHVLEAIKRDLFEFPGDNF